MRRIELKTVEADDKADFDYRDVLIGILRVRGQGMDLAEMETALGCIGKIKRGEAYADVEDAEHKYLMERVKEHRWRIADTAIVQFVKDLENAPAPPELERAP